MLTAFQNVADTLTALDQDAEALKATAAAADAAKTSSTCRGSSTRTAMPITLPCSTPSRRYQQARLSLVQAEASRFADTAALFQALGGGWWHRPDLTGTPMRLIRRWSLARLAARGCLLGRLLVGKRRRRASTMRAVANVRLTAAQRQPHPALHGRSASPFGSTIKAPGTVDFDNDQATDRDCRRSTAR